MKTDNVIRQQNQSTLLNLLKKINKATIPEIANSTGLSVVTVTAILKSLMEKNEVLADMEQSMTGGRPAKIYRINKNCQKCLLICTYQSETQDKVHYIVINLTGEVIDEKIDIFNPNGIQCFDSEIRRFLEKDPEISCLCLALPGVEIEGNMKICDYNELKNTALSKYLKEQFHLPVWIENDMNITISGYCRSHPDLKEKTVLGIYFPGNYPPGAGIIINGTIYKGKNAMAGEIKYLLPETVWKKPPEEYLITEKQKHLLIKALIVSFAPEHIIFYDERIGTSYLERLHCVLNEELSPFMIPELTHDGNLAQDYRTGLIHFGIKKMSNETE